MRSVAIFWDQQLGAGGEGSVYLGRFLDGPWCAVKLPPVELHGLVTSMPAVRAQVQQRMMKECARVNRVVGQRLVRLLGDGLGAPIPFMALELAVDGSLADEMEACFKDEYVYHPVWALRRIMDVLLALDEAPASNVVHRDVKPANLLLFGERVKLSDFGVARSLLRPFALQTQARIGTNRYAAPEQLAVSFVGAAADVYAAGVILYEMLTGIVPSLDTDRLTRTFVSPATVYGHITDALDFFLSSLLNDNPWNRPTASDAFRLAKSVLREYEVLVARGLV